MKIAICDICHYRHKKTVKSVYRNGYKGRENLKIDVCEEHKNVLSKEKVTMQNQWKWFHELVYGNSTESVNENKAIESKEAENYAKC